MHHSVTAHLIWLYKLLYKPVAKAMGESKFWPAT